MAEPDWADTPSAREELEFWTREFEGGGQFSEVLGARLDPARREAEFPELLSHGVLDLLEKQFAPGRPLRGLEIGPGPLSTLAWGVDQGRIDVTAVDVLGDQFARLIDRFAPDFPIRPMTGRGEDLPQILGPEPFEFVYVRNAIDHTDDLPTVFTNMVRLTRPNGAIVLQHHLNEGSHREWSASHKWNLDHGIKGLMATDRDGGKHNFADRDDIQLEYLHYRSYVFDGWVDAIYRRL